MNRQPLRLAVVGCGDIARFVAWFARLNRKIHLAAACDISLERAEQFARRFKISQAFADYETMLARAELDAVYLAVPHHLHYQMIETAVSHRLPVFTEKPLTRTLAEGQQIVQLAAQAGVKVGVNYQYRYDSGCHRLALAAQSGVLGSIHAARINVPWHREASYFNQAGWHSKIATAGGGTLITQGSHFLDIVLWALGIDQPKTAVGYTAQRKFGKRDTALGKTDAAIPGRDKEGQPLENSVGQFAKSVDDIEVEDLAQGIVEMESGALIQICSMMVASSEQPARVELFGERGTAVYTPSPLPHTKFRDVRVKVRKPSQRGIHALQRSLEGFRSWIMDDQPYLIPANEALPALAVVEAIYRSARTGKKEEVRDWRMEIRD